jgi:hypothetical protein
MQTLEMKLSRCSQFPSQETAISSSPTPCTKVHFGLASVACVAALEYNGGGCWSSNDTKRHNVNTQAQRDSSHSWYDFRNDSSMQVGHGKNLQWISWVQYHFILDKQKKKKSSHSVLKQKFFFKKLKISTAFHRMPYLNWFRPIYLSTCVAMDD